MCSFSTIISCAASVQSYHVLIEYNQIMCLSSTIKLCAQSSYHVLYIEYVVHTTCALDDGMCSWCNNNTSLDFLMVAVVHQNGMQRSHVLWSWCSSSGDVRSHVLLSSSIPMRACGPLVVNVPLVGKQHSKGYDHMSSCHGVAVVVICMITYALEMV